MTGPAPVDPRGPPPAPAAAAPRFTLDGSPDLEAHLARTCGKILAGLQGLIPERRLQAVLLGGGYGRGEGGVRRTPDGDLPYNDLEFYVLLRGNRHLNTLRYHRPLEVLGEILSPQAGVEVEFKITSLPALARAPVGMFTYDLVAGHRWLLGHEGLLAGWAHHRRADLIPPGEATRLLMNRSTGLLLAQERLGRPEFTAADADFVRRNIAKAELALGDAVLALHGRYHWSCLERNRRLAVVPPGQTPPFWPEIRSRHAAGTAFKLHPERSAEPAEVLQRRLEGVRALSRHVWLWVEQRRLGGTVESIVDYARQPAPLTIGAAAWRNRLLQIRRGRWREAWGFPGSRHPREPVLRALAVLLWLPPRRAQSTLRRIPGAAAIADAPDFATMVDAYRDRWLEVR